MEFGSMPCLGRVGSGLQCSDVAALDGSVMGLGWAIQGDGTEMVRSYCGDGTEMLLILTLGGPVIQAVMLNALVRIFRSF